MTIATVRNEPLARTLTWAVLRAVAGGIVAFLVAVIFSPSNPHLNIAAGVAVGLLLANLITDVLFPTLAARRKR